MEKVRISRLLKVNVRAQVKYLAVLKGSTDSTSLFNVHPLVEAFNSQNKTTLKVVSPKLGNAALVGKMNFYLPTFIFDASIAYERPDIRFNDKIIFSPDHGSRVIMPTYSYKGEKNIALVVLGLNSRDFRRDGNTIIFDIPESRLIAIPNFPDSDGWHMPDPETLVPFGMAVERSQDTRYLYRLDSSYAGFLAHSVLSGHDRIIAGYRSFEGVGVVAEVPDEDFVKLNKSIPLKLI